jgi:hypothetical protein
MLEPNRIQRSVSNIEADVISPTKVSTTGSLPAGFVTGFFCINFGSFCWTIGAEDFCDNFFQSPIASQSMTESTPPQQKQVFSTVASHVSAADKMKLLSATVS